MHHHASPPMCTMSAQQERLPGALWAAVVGAATDATIQAQMLFGHLSHTGR
jgi:hypothetical protein